MEGEDGGTPIRDAVLTHLLVFPAGMFVENSALMMRYYWNLLECDVTSYSSDGEYHPLGIRAPFHSPALAVPQGADFIGVALPWQG